jgi:dTMP kinase
MKFNGKFITLEGLESVGKTTLSHQIYSYLNQKGIKSILTRDPGGTSFSEKIRKILLTSCKETIIPETELLLIFASRYQLFEHIIKPALNKGYWVICSRYTDSTYAYQGGGRGINFSKIDLLNNNIYSTIVPDITFILDLPIEINMQRIAIKKNIDRIEKESIIFFNKVRDVYLNKISLYSRSHIINANRSIASIMNNISELLNVIINK